MTICYLFTQKGAFMSDWTFLGRYSSIEQAKESAVKKIGKDHNKMLAITSTPELQRAGDIMWTVQFQKGSLYWKGEKAKEHTGYVFNGYGGRDSYFVKLSAVEDGKDWHPFGL